VEDKVDHLSEDGGFGTAADADSGASRGNKGFEASGHGHSLYPLISSSARFALERCEISGKTERPLATPERTVGSPHSGR
jgi:hypothetical protein